MCISLLVKYPLFLSDFYKTSVFFDRLLKNTQILNLVKIRPMGAELFHAEGRTERQTDGHDEANSRFSKFRERA